jgi:glycosyltransferase involved in cell wall biosynthesis
LNVPFTIRAHSFDVLSGDLATVNLRAIGSSSAFRGVLCFPFMRQRFIDAGVPGSKVFACNPVIDVQRFRNIAPNGPDIMNVGSAQPKKNMEDFIRLSKLVPQRRFNLYGLGYDVPQLREINSKLGGRTHFIAPVDPEAMPAEYKKHCWLVYTASRTVNTVGWPMALIEAQASGVGVYVQRIRDDLREYIGEAGSFFDTPEELADVLRSPPSEATRGRGFEWAEQFDYRKQLGVLTDLWR